MCESEIDQYRSYLEAIRLIENLKSEWPNGYGNEHISAKLAWALEDLKEELIDSMRPK